MACLYFCDFTSHGAQVYILSWCVLCRYFCTYFSNCVNNCHMVICSLELLEISPAYFKLSTYSFWMRLFLSRLKICFQFPCQVYSNKKIEHRCEQMYAVGSPYHKLSYKGLDCGDKAIPSSVTVTETVVLTKQHVSISCPLSSHYISQPLLQLGWDMRLILAKGCERKWYISSILSHPGRYELSWQNLQEQTGSLNHCSEWCCSGEPSGSQWNFCE